MNNIANDFTTLVNDGEHAVSNKFTKIVNNVMHDQALLPTLKT